MSLSSPAKPAGAAAASGPYAPAAPIAGSAPREPAAWRGQKPVRLPPSHHRVRNVGAIPLVGGVGIGHWPRSRSIIAAVENNLFFCRIFDDGTGIVVDIERNVVAGAMAQRAPDQLRLPA